MTKIPLWMSLWKRKKRQKQFFANFVVSADTLMTWHEYGVWIEHQIVSKWVLREGWIIFWFESSIRLSPNGSLVKGGLYFGLIEQALLIPSIVMLCFGSNIPQNNVYDPGISYQVSCLALPLYFKWWDHSGHLFYPSPWGQGKSLGARYCKTS